MVITHSAMLRTMLQLVERAAMLLSPVARFDTASFCRQRGSCLGLDRAASIGTHHPRGYRSGQPAAGAP